MIVRVDEHGVLAIGQQSHAWISGQLARAWGNERFGSVTPAEEVCLAAEQHDVAWGRWDLSPSRNPETGFPHSFTEMPIEGHLALWDRGPRRLLSQSRYATLLVSLHGTRLFERRDTSTLNDREVSAVGDYLERQRTFQRELRAGLEGDPAYAALASEELIARNRQLLWIWDYISLALCLDWAPCTARRVPAAGDAVDIELRPAGPLGVELEPWPFASAGLAVRCEARRLPERAGDEDELARALEHAPWETLDFELRSG